MSGEWTGGIVDGHTDDSPPTVEEWRSVAVPGTRASFADATEPMAYRTTVADPRADERDRALLKLRGNASRAEIWLNGTCVGHREPFVGPFRTVFDPQPENELIVICERPSAVVDTGESTDATEHGTSGVPWAVDVEARPQTFCRRLEARPRFTEDGGVIDVECEVDAGEAVDDAITLSLRPEGFRGSAAMQRVPIRVGAGERVTVSDTLEIREPSLWWPQGYGPQHRYTVRAKLGDDAISKTVGFCNVERDGDEFLINGRPVWLRGFARLPGGDPVADVERAAAANATFVRANGHVPPESLYAACDEAGLLVWQDVAEVGPNDEPSTDEADVLAATLAKRHAHRPSAAIYGVSDESSAPFDGLYGSGFLTKLRFRYRARRADVDHGAAESVADAVAQRVAETVAESTAEAADESMPGSPAVVSSTGPPGTDADATRLSLGWEYLSAADLEWLLERDRTLGRLVAGFDAGSLASGDADPAEIPGFDAAVLERRVGADAGLEESQRYQTETLKTVAETLRRHESSLLTGPPLRDAAPGGGMGVVSHDGEEKPAYRALARSLEPVQAVLDGPPTPGSVGITLCNDTHDALEATVSWVADDDEGETTVAVDPLETTAAGTARISGTATRIELTVTVGERQVRNRYRL
ncbi:glycoside hydrolase family 2 protein [Natronorubrum texcoconense]|uniref:Beta-mannosidase n=1 Tax=Natronorubrum texcoconense TaxID=1095776 RepID=A0A1G8WXY3_9EURY|nr:glycoside hydrolase family 2 [Natronorubrum texcoconense]SDJ83229.1 beta-mannosidase [Natronorubrum texcoconense]